MEQARDTYDFGGAALYARSLHDVTLSTETDRAPASAAGTSSFQVRSSRACARTTGKRNCHQRRQPVDPQNHPAEESSPGALRFLLKGDTPHHQVRSHTPARATPDRAKAPLPQARFLRLRGRAERGPAQCRGFSAGSPQAGQGWLCRSESGPPGRRGGIAQRARRRGLCRGGGGRRRVRSGATGVGSRSSAMGATGTLWPM
jgi:hypothetical protein